MRAKTATSQNRAPRITPSMPWRVAKVHPLSNYCLAVVFLDGTKGEVDLSKLITSKKAGVFAILSDPNLFNQVSVKLGAVTWPGEIDLPPDEMYRQIKQLGKWIIN